jgi:hypothetical protein
LSVVAVLSVESLVQAEALSAEAVVAVAESKVTSNSLDLNISPPSESIQTRVTEYFSPGVRFVRL